VTLLHNNHSFKMGGEYIRLYVFTEAGFLNNGSFNFSGQFTGNALADFLVGRPANYSRQTYVSETRLTKHGAAFFQDDWKVSPRLTLNLGLRYQVQKPYVSVFLNNLFPDVKSTYRAGEQSVRLPHAPRGLVYAGDPGIPRGLYETDWTQFEPRLGLAWDIRGDGKTSLRLGYGLYHDIVYADTFAQSGGIPVLYSEFFNAPAGGVSNPYLGFPNPWPIAGDLNSPFATPTSFGSIPGDFKNPRVHQFTVDVQRQITRNLMFEAAYAGKLSKNLVTNLQLNPAVYIPGTDAAGLPLSTPANINERRPLAPVFGSIRSIESKAEATYHSMQLTSRYRLNRGLSFTAAYTWSKSIDNMSVAGLAGAVPQDPFDPLRGNRGLSDYDVTNVFAASWVYELPTPFKNQAFLGALTSGWELTGITRLTSGLPFSVISGVNNSLNGEGQDRADLIGNPHFSGSRSRDEQLSQWFNTAAFAVNPVGRVGNSGRNILRGPHQYNTDLGVIRNFSLGENIGKLQFRAEFFNAFNQVRLGLPNNVRSSPAFGRITSALNPRLVQFAIKFTR
jgi:TonB dependent receptor